MKYLLFIWFGLLFAATICFAATHQWNQDATVYLESPPSSTLQYPISNIQRSAAAGDPLLYFSDLTSGPKTGNMDTSGGRSGQDGAVVTIWGRNLGSSRSSSQVFVNGAEAASYYAWGNATAPADLYTYLRHATTSWTPHRGQITARASWTVFTLHA
jgi:hypothetical protein